MKINYEEYVREIAHSIWENEGCPDGEIEIETFFGKIKLKEQHWIKAEMIADFDMDIFRMLETQDAAYNERII